MKKDPVANEDGLAVVDETVTVAKVPEDLGDDDASKAELVCGLCVCQRRVTLIFQKANTVGLDGLHLYCSNYWTPFPTTAICRGFSCKI